MPKQLRSIFCFFLTDKIIFFLVHYARYKQLIFVSVSGHKGRHSRIQYEGYQIYSNRLFIVSLQIRLSFSGDAHLLDQMGAERVA